MEVKYQRNEPIQPAAITSPKKDMSVRRLLNILGIIFVPIIILSTITAPISLNQQLELYINSEAMLKSEEAWEFSLFILSFAMLYFLFVNILSLVRYGRLLLYLGLTLLLIGSLAAVFMLIGVH
ncbi:hypothetical protein GJU40_06690 [Bacillus lacus]|uniref:Uncharacterized protein n=1 Tax=Metabacillus lacus TaxID=1983721 RepID=A0A7X2IY82_9BACI|nr:hypothetical protein [Metabacillus lacus]MRX71860.1 hypothetical protein [Metabacillus lacus]